MPADWCSVLGLKIMATFVRRSRVIQVQGDHLRIQCHVLEVKEAAAAGRWLPMSEPLARSTIGGHDGIQFSESLATNGSIVRLTPRSRPPSSANDP